MFEIEKLGVYARPLNYSYTADFATCREKPEIQPSNVINETLDFLRGDKKQVKSPIEQHETIYRDNESNHKTNDTVYTVTRNLDDTPIEDTVPDITIEDTENAEIQAKSKKPSSNFANAKIF